MPKRVGKYPMAFRQMAVERMRHCASVSALAQELGVDRTVLYHWRRLTPGEAGSADTSPVRELRKEIRDLKRLLAEKRWKRIFSKVSIRPYGPRKLMKIILSFKIVAAPERRDRARSGEVEAVKVSDPRACVLSE